MVAAPGPTSTHESAPGLVVLLIAPPGAGKGTQATLLASRYGIEHLSIGAVLRDLVATGTTVGRAASRYLQRGDLVPDEVVLDVVTPRLERAIEHGGCVLDGFPRSVSQADAAYGVIARTEVLAPPAVVHLDVGHDELRRRLMVRALHEGRSDDVESVFEHRMAAFSAAVGPLLQFCADRGPVAQIDGGRPVAQVHADIVSFIEELYRGALSPKGPSPAMG